MDYLIKVNNLSYKIGDNHILKNLNFFIEKNDYLGIIGPNGGGKTTLIKILLGLVKPTSGSITIGGVNIENYKNKFQIGYVPQKSSQANYNFPFSVKEIIESGLTPKLGFFRNSEEKDKEFVKKIMGLTGVDKYSERLIDQLSGGEKQKVFIARALVAKPKILILDEPTVGVDFVSQQNFYSFLKTINKDWGLTIILVSHELEVVADEVTHIMCLNKTLVCHTHPKDLEKNNFLKKLYGVDVKLVSHKH